VSTAAGLAAGAESTDRPNVDEPTTELSRTLPPLQPAHWIRASPAQISLFDWITGSVSEVNNPAALAALLPTFSSVFEGATFFAPATPRPMYGLTNPALVILLANT